MASSEHESRSILDDRVYVYNASRSPRATLPFSPSPPLLRNREQDETAGQREIRDPLGIRDPRQRWNPEGLPEREMREPDQEPRVASIAGQKLNVARFELLKLEI